MWTGLASSKNIVLGGRAGDRCHPASQIGWDQRLARSLALPHFRATWCHCHDWSFKCTFWYHENRGRGDR